MKKDARVQHILDRSRERVDALVERLADLLGVPEEPPPLSSSWEPPSSETPPKGPPPVERS